MKFLLLILPFSTGIHVYVLDFAKLAERRSVGYNGGMTNDNTTAHSKIIANEPIDFNNEQAIREQLEDFAQRYRNAPIEYARIISPNGRVYTVKGQGSIVHPHIIGEDALRGSIGIHSHPVPQGGEVSGDSFSKGDLVFAARDKTGKQYLVTGERRNAFEFTKEFTLQEISQAWGEAEKEAIFDAALKNRDVENRQEATLRILSEILEGFEYHENF